MKLLDIFLSSVVTCITSLPLILLLLMLQQESAVAPNPPLDQARIREVRQLLIDHDPRQLLASDTQEVRLSEDELNALVTYIKNSNDVLAGTNIRIGLVDAGIDVATSIPVQGLGLHRYVNLNLHLRQTGDRLTLAQVDAGALTLPPPLMTPIKRALGRQLAREANFRLVSSFVDSLHFLSISPERVMILLDWQQDDLSQPEEQARQTFVSTREARRLQNYHDRLVTTLDTIPEGVRTIGLNDLLRPMFLYASLNSTDSADPAAENRAAFLVLNAYLTDEDLARLIGRDITLATPRRLRVVIENREDLARHVASSAAIAASAGTAMAEVLSVYKEVHDASYRTGFSFTDIAANQAGALLGTLASRSDADARRFQDLMKNSVTEADFLPPPGTYDGMTEQQFLDRYGSTDSEAYRQKLEEITDVIITLPFYQAFAE